MQTTATIAKNVVLTAIETDSGARVTITYRGETIFERDYEDHELVEAAVIAQDDAAGEIAFALAGDKTIAAIGRKLAKMSENVVIEGTKAIDRACSRLTRSGAPFAVESAVYAETRSMMRAREQAAAEERKAARDTARTAELASDRAAWDARYGALDAATLGYQRDLGLIPRRP